MRGVSVRRPRLALLLAGLAALLLTPLTHAARIGIDAGNDPDSRLEIRTLTLPDGEEAQLYVLTGEALRVSIDDALLEANHVEVDLTNRLIRVIGPGRYTSGGELVEGVDLILDLRAEAFAGDDVLIVSDGIQVKGDNASRVPGLIRVALGEFSPCTRCNQEIEDYGFVAEQLEIYPGDRLVAFGVTVLIRGARMLSLPLLVLPVGPQERRPRFEYETGTSSKRARIAVSWPYVAGPNAYGEMGVRYYADVKPGASAVGDFFLGGAVSASYVGGHLLHRYYTERGKGVFSVDYTPAFIEEGEGGDPKVGAPIFKVRFRYADEETLGPPQTQLLVERDDARREGLWEATLVRSETAAGIAGRFTSQFFLDMSGEGQLRTPSYASRATPLMTPARVELTPAEIRDLDFGALRVERLLLDLGVFQDRSNSLNRSAARRPVILAARAFESHRVTLAPVQLYRGLELSGRTDFTGYYYSTAERQVEWLTRVTLEQAFGGAGSLAVTFRRDVREGETPFRFDLFPYRTRTEMAARLSLHPARWVSFEQSGGYAFFDDRNPDEVGWQPLKSTLTLLGTVNWVSLTLSNEYDLKENDPGTLDAALTLRAPGSLIAEAEVKHSHDLKVTPDRVTGAPNDTTETAVSARLGLRGVAELSAKTAYRYRPLPAEPGEPLEHFDDLVLKLTLGTLRHDDAVPGVAVSYSRDLNRGESTAFELTAAVTALGLQFDATQRLTLPSGRLAKSQLRAALPGVAALEVEGVHWFNAAWLGLPEPEPYARTLAFTLEEAPLRGRPEWQVRFTTRYDPTLSAQQAGGAYSNSLLSGRALLTDYTAGPVRFSVDAFAELMWPDDEQHPLYLRRANLMFAASFDERVGLQGRMGYAGVYSASAGEVTSARLTLQDVALVVRPLDSLYLGAVISDVWELTGTSSDTPSFNLQPKFVVVWNRCCWALYGSWDSASGALAVTLTTPGADQGITNVFETGWVLPRREP